MAASKIIFYDWKARSKSLAEFFLFSLSFRIFSFSGFCSFLVLSFRQLAAVGRCCQAAAGPAGAAEAAAATCPRSRIFWWLTFV